MDKIRRLVGGMPYLEEDYFIDWRGKLEDYFYPATLDDIGRLDSSAYDYLLSLNKGNEKLSSKEIDHLIKNNLLVLRDRDLRKLVSYHGEMVSIYYKYFDDEYESSKKIPF